MFDIKLIVKAMLDGPARPAYVVPIDDEYVLQGGHVAECTWRIQDIMIDLMAKGFLAVPIDGTVRAINWSVIISIDFVLVDALEEEPEC